MLSKREAASHLFDVSQSTQNKDMPQSWFSRSISLALPMPVHDNHGSQASQCTSTDLDNAPVQTNDVEELLWGSQLDLIAHRHALAAQKLMQAVELGSSAACASLGNLMSRGLRGNSTTSPNGSAISIAPAMPTSSSSHAAASSFHLRMHSGTSWRNRPPPFVTSSVDADALAAARLYYCGLKIELDKLVKQQEPQPAFDKGKGKGRVSPETADLDISYDDYSENDDESDGEEGIEGRFFNIERASDLVIGLTDSYRFGIIKPPTIPQGADPNPEEPIVNSLWQEGAELASYALEKFYLPTPLVTWGSDLDETHVVSSSAFSASPIMLRGRPSLSSNVHSRPSTPEDPTSSSFLNTNALSHQPQTKLALTIRVHLLYILALKSWSLNNPEGRREAEANWEEIALVGEKGIGTKKGEEILLSALKRLGKGPDTANISFAKKNLSATRKSHTFAYDENSSPGGIKDSNDALAEIARERVARRVSPSTTSCRSFLTGSGFPSNVMESSTYNRQSRTDPASSSSGATVRPIGTTCTMTASGPDLRVIGNPADSTFTVGSQKMSKFHFANSSDYPSPPDTPGSGSIGEVLSFDFRQLPIHHTISPDSPPSPNRIVEPPSAPPSLSANRSSNNLSSVVSSAASHYTNTSSWRTVGRVASTTSLQPPNLLRRVKSSASISTVPPDFFSSQASGSTLPSSVGTTVPSPLSTAAVVTAENMSRSASRTTPPASYTSSTSNDSEAWSFGLRRKLHGFPSTSNLKMVGEIFSSTLTNTFKFRTRLDRKNSAVDLLQKILKKDDASAGPGMYWANVEDLDRDEVESEVDDLDVGLGPEDVLSYTTGDDDTESDACEERFPSHPSQHRTGRRPFGNRRKKGRSKLGEEALLDVLIAKTSEGSIEVFDQLQQRGVIRNGLPDSMSKAASRGDAPLKLHLSSRPNSILTTSSSKVSSVSSSDSLRKLVLREERPKLLPRQRSFIDPTTSRRGASGHATHSNTSIRSRPHTPVPKLVRTPATPDQYHTLHRTAPNSPIAGKRSPLEHHHHLQHHQQQQQQQRYPVKIDPILLELEKQSRVGVRTLCATCKKRGFNYPACPKCEQTYCSRNCRVSDQGAGDGRKHLCGPMALCVGNK